MKGYLKTAAVLGMVSMLGACQLILLAEREEYVPIKWYANCAETVLKVEPVERRLCLCMVQASPSPTSG